MIILAKMSAIELFTWIEIQASVGTTDDSIRFFLCYVTTKQFHFHRPDQHFSSGRYSEEETDVSRCKQFCDHASTAYH